MLEDLFTPSHYFVRLQPYVNGNHTIPGYVEITFQVKNETSLVTLHALDLDINHGSIKVYEERKPDAAFEVTGHSADEKEQQYSLNLNLPLIPDRVYKLTCFFTAELNKKMVGLYLSTYEDENGITRNLAATQFAPTDARRVFPCFDEPALKAKFTIEIAREEHMTAVCNMPISETVPKQDEPGWFWDKFATTVPMSTYLVAVIVSEFSYLESHKNKNVLFRVWARPQAIDQAAYSLKIGPDILTFYDSYFGIPYPLPKQDMVAIPDMLAGAMENWGLIIYRETTLLYDPKVSSTRNKQTIGEVVAHELAHQWFGNLVTMKWWSDLWLNEGFASYVEYLGLDAVEPSFKMLEQFVVDNLQPVFRLDALKSSHPISIPVYNPDQINEIFDDISYSKGTSIVRMTNHFLTEETFRAGLNNYLKAFAYGNAEQDDLWEYWTRQAHADGRLDRNLTVKMIMDTWTLQMGYPVLTVSIQDNGTALLQQERFLMLKDAEGSDSHDYKWWIPLSFTFQDKPDFSQTKAMLWMSTSESSKTIPGMPSKDKWVVFNIQETGYYRVNYDNDNWNLLIQQLHSDYHVIHTINRSQMVDDILNLARAGLASYRTALALLGYLIKETEYTPWMSAFAGLKYLYHMVESTNAIVSFKNYLLSMMTSLYKSIGFTEEDGDPHLVKMQRISLVSWLYDLRYPDVMKNAVDLFRAWMDNPENNSIIPSSLKFTVYSAGIAEGGEKAWNFAWEQYKKTQVATEKDYLLKALGSSKDSKLINRYLELVFETDSGVRKQDAFKLFLSASCNPAGRDLAFKYATERWQALFNEFGSTSFTLPGIVKTVTSRINTPEGLRKVLEFRERNKDTLGVAARSVDQAIETIRSNISWMETHYEEIYSWLKDKGY